GASGEEADSLAVQAAAADSAAADKKKSKGGFLAALFNRNKDDDEEEEVVPVELADVKITDMPAYLGTTATLDAEKRAEILAKIEGEILRIHVEEGDWVREAQVLAVLDGAVQQVTLEEAEARFRAVELDLERTKGLFGEQLASEKDLHDARFRFEESQAQRKAAQLRLDYTRILAPFSGLIAERFVDPGQAVAPGASIFSIVDTDPLLARIHLPEREAMKITPGLEVVINPNTDPALRFSGEVLRVAPVVDARTGTVKVTCKVSGMSPGLKPGSFVRVRVRTELKPDVLTIPKRALVPEGGEIYVFKAVADSVIKVPVVTGLTNHTLVEVAEGLQAGEKVVTVGQGALKTGSKIREIQCEQATVADSTPGGAF
ncbi:MAG: efflux RND transporter periplasmic adaptor subunit, partial [Candidatus Eisenbacteria sp.]|nr:efflux RND transporter periplasmic adaptor subunit [Candidatus Eisenbacteria bacterium]